MVPDNQSQPILKHATPATDLLRGGGEGPPAQGGGGLDMSGAHHHGPASASISDGGLIVYPNTCMAKAIGP